MNRTIDVFILTYCRSLEMLYGTELIFRTLRTGFPSARVTVVDNASLPEARERVARLARENDAAFRTIADPGVEHHDFLERTLAEAAAHGTGPLVFLDPDICLWDDCQGFEFDALIAGRLIDAYDDDVFQCVAMPRLHTSFLWIPDPRRLWAEIETIRARRFDFRPFLSTSLKLGDAWIRYDSGASLYAALGERTACFGDAHLDRYDHIYSGSHLHLLAARFHPRVREMMLAIHDLAKTGQIAALKGIRHRQEQVWAEVYGRRNDAS
jgi:hypothetical protein